VFRTRSFGVEPLDLASDSENLGRPATMPAFRRSSGLDSAISYPLR